jgi:ABC-2 type transport system permease protein
VAFATTFPAQALLGTVDLRLLIVGIALATVALILTHLFWRYAVRYYSSASS